MKPIPATLNHDPELTRQILAYFQENTATVLTAVLISNQFERDLDQTQKALDHLVSSHLLQRLDYPGSASYRLMPSA